MLGQRTYVIFNMQGTTVGRPRGRVKVGNSKKGKLNPNVDYLFVLFV